MSILFDNGANSRKGAPVDVNFQAGWLAPGKCKEGLGKKGGEKRTRKNTTGANASDVRICSKGEEKEKYTHW